MPVPDTESDALSTARSALARHFGFDEFLPGQEPVVSALIEGKDVLAVMPTGGGKSLCYQLPAMVKEGVTLVVSPLIALMKDQVDGLLRKNIPVTLINSTLTLSEQNERLRELAAGHYKIVYIAPERFRSSSFLRALSQVPIALVAVDEAHCLSQWGHDFRPDYLRLSRALDTLGRPQTAAFTATATPDVRADILKVLLLRDPFVSISGFERPNLSLRVVHCDNHREKYDRLEKLIATHRTGIIYCSTRKKVEEVSASLSAQNVKLVAYHGGMNDKDREWAQNVFLDRSYDVVVATNAFGMGIDRPDVRFVAHFDVPGSIEAYYQEAGRAGRDGEPSDCELLFNYADTRTQEFFIEGNNPSLDMIRSLYAVIHRLSGPTREDVLMSIQEMTDALDLKNSMQVSSALSYLMRSGHIERFDVPGERIRGTRIVDPSIDPYTLPIDGESLHEKNRRDQSKLDAMIQFCFDQGNCRQQWILEYFGESNSSPCGSCDFCETAVGHDRRPPTDEEFLIVQKALSGIARTCNRASSGDWEGRFGKTKIVSMLTGVRSQDMSAARLDKLSTYGLLQSEGATYVGDLLQELERAGLTITRRTPYPLLGLTRRGSDVMRGERNFYLTWPKRSHPASKKDAKRTEDPPTEPPNPELLARLKTLRKQLASEAGGVPPYVIFGNAVLESFASILPTTMDEATEIRGVGKVKAERYLAPFLAEIQNFLEGGD